MQVFISNISGQETLIAQAESVGLKYGEICGRGWDTTPALGGNTFAVKDTLKANGARWNSTCKVWTFESREALTGALIAVAAK